MKNIAIALLLLLVFINYSCKEISREKQSAAGYALRLSPGQDLKLELEKFVQAKQLQASSVVTCVGSLTTFKIRPANQKDLLTLKGHFEIVSLTGTFADKGQHNHLHISVSDSTGRTIGGHLVEGNIIYTTAEITLLDLPQLKFTREVDPQTGYYELSIKE
ncbi:MAG: PPC domain-containing DNA-binding protein [Marinifilaceae bacterium]